MNIAKRILVFGLSCRRAKNDDALQLRQGKLVQYHEF
jgi:hypothetical protein